VQQCLPRLGVFQGGAMEERLLLITEISEVQWPAMRGRLQAAALIEMESLEGVLYLKFHPSLAPLLWSQLPQPEQDALSARHRRSYYHFSTALILGDRKLPHHFHAIARRELPNLLYAVHGALAASNEWAPDFTNNVGYFLNVFGLNREYRALTELAAALEPETGSRASYAYHFNLGTQLLESGRIQQAEAVFREVLVGLGASPSDKRCETLLKLGECYRSLGQLDLAEKFYREASAAVDTLEQSAEVKLLRGASQYELGNVMTDMARYAEAQAAYENALTIAEELEGFRQIGLINAQLGTLALSQRDLPEAARRYGEALSLFHRLNEPMREASYGHQLGIVFERAGQSEAAEKAYRDSARIAEALEDFTGAAHSWYQLAGLSEDAGNLQAAEAWYRKALEGYRIGGSGADLSKTLANLAYLLQNRSGRLAEARQLAEESLSIKKTLDPGAAQIWRIYGVLARIADKENAPARERDYRRRQRAAYTNFPGNLDELQRYTKLIAAVHASISGNLAAQHAVSREQEVMRQAGGQWVGLPQAIDHLLAGERDADVLTANLDALPSLIVEAILEGIKEPRQPRSPARQ
jgi:tetratricopeptide (TPR) repeat protein